MEEIRPHPLRNYRHIHCVIETRLKTVVFPLSGEPNWGGVFGSGYLPTSCNFGSVGLVLSVGRGSAKKNGTNVRRWATARVSELHLAGPLTYTYKGLGIISSVFERGSVQYSSTLYLTGANYWPEYSASPFFEYNLASVISVRNGIYPVRDIFQRFPNCIVVIKNIREKETWRELVRCLKKSMPFIRFVQIFGIKMVKVIDSGTGRESCT